jgi:ATP-dependent Clp protease ATP-binding subunit ClpB
MAYVQAAFRPEFLNRLDEIILFHRLNKIHMHKIVRIQLNELKKIIATQSINFEYDESAVDYLSDKGYDPAFGARPLKRLIQKEVQNHLAKELLAGKYTSGDSVKLTCKNGQLVI